MAVAQLLRRDLNCFDEKQLAISYCALSYLAKRSRPMTNSSCRASYCSLTYFSIQEGAVLSYLVSVVMPCLNEASTLAACIEQAHAGCRAVLNAHSHYINSVMTDNFADGTTAMSYEIIIADNGSTDGSQELAKRHGARVVIVERKGYGEALRRGISAAQGKYIIMGDSDCSYDFGEVNRFLDKLEEGYDLVMGNRFTGGIKPGAMPWHHRYIGNPLLSGLGRILYHTPCRDWHCGLRAFRREVIQQLDLRAQGMEFASEIVLAFAKKGLRSSEIPIQLSPDKRNRRPHLRSFRDGLRHIHCMLSNRMRVC